MMTPDEYANGVLLAYVLVGSIRRLDFEGMLAAMGRAGAVGAFVDPTLAREKLAAMLEDKTVVEILARAKRDLEQLAWPPSDDAIALRSRARMLAHAGGLPFSVKQAEAVVRDDSGDASRVLAGGAL